MTGPRSAPGCRSRRPLRTPCPPATASDSITLDTTKPTIPMSPAPSFTKAHLGTTAVPILSTWSGADAGSGVNHFDFEESIDGGAFTLLSHPTGTSATVNLNPGHT